MEDEGSRTLTGWTKAIFEVSLAAASAASSVLRARSHLKVCTAGVDGEGEGLQEGRPLPEGPVPALRHHSSDARGQTTEPSNGQERQEAKAAGAEPLGPQVGAACFLIFFLLFSRSKAIAEYHKQEIQALEFKNFNLEFVSSVFK